MGVGSSKHPDWYPGEPAAGVSHCGECSCRNNNDKDGGGGGGGEATARSVVENGSSTQNRRPAAAAGELLDNGGGATCNHKKKRSIASLVVIELTEWEFIANGAFCAVHTCKYRRWPVVAKRVRRDLPLAERRAALANLWNEYECLRGLDHPNVIEAYGLCRVRRRVDAGNAWDELDVCLMVERLALGTVGHLFGTTRTVEKNLATAMARSRKMKRLPFRCRLDRILELALALEYVHGGSGLGTMMHRDIKSVNVGFAQNGNLKLMDFGLSKIVAPRGAAESETYKMTGEVGSYRYMAPELVKHFPYNVKADVYSWAILSWEIIDVNRPFSGVSESSYVKRVVFGGERPNLPKSWPERLRAVFTSAWHADLHKRPTSAEIVAELRVVRTELSAREHRRRPSLTSSTADASSWAQGSVSAPTTLGHAGAPPSGADGGAGGASGASGANSSRYVAPPIPATPAKTRFSFSLPRPSPEQRSRWAWKGAGSRGTARANGNGVIGGWDSPFSVRENSAVPSGRGRNGTQGGGEGGLLLPGSLALGTPANGRRNGGGGRGSGRGSCATVVCSSVAGVGGGGRIRRTSSFGEYWGWWWRIIVVAELRGAPGGELSLRKMIVDALARESDRAEKGPESAARRRRPGGLPPVYGSNGGRKGVDGAERWKARKNVVARRQEAQRSSFVSASSASDDEGDAVSNGGGDKEGRGNLDDNDVKPPEVEPTEEGKLAESRRRVSTETDNEKESAVDWGVAKEGGTSSAAATVTSSSANGRGPGMTRRDSRLSKLWPAAPVPTASAGSAKDFLLPPRPPGAASDVPNSSAKKKAWIWGGGNKDADDGKEDGAKGSGSSTPALTMVLDAVRDSKSLTRGDGNGVGDDINGVVDQLTVSESARFGRHAPSEDMGASELGRLERPAQRGRNPREYARRAHVFAANELAPL